MKWICFGFRFFFIFVCSVISYCVNIKFRMGGKLREWDSVTWREVEERCKSVIISEWFCLDDGLPAFQFLINWWACMMLLITNSGLELCTTFRINCADFISWIIINSLQVIHLLMCWLNNWTEWCLLMCADWRRRMCCVRPLVTTFSVTSAVLPVSRTPKSTFSNFRKRLPGLMPLFVAFRL